jgi:diguanylate cyclase (GGDEF)-like protein
MESPRDRRTIAYTAAGIYAGAAFVGILEAAVGSGQTFSNVPGGIVLLITPLIMALGPRCPRAALAALGPVGVALIAFALASTRGYGDGGVLYMWPVLWMSHFYGRRGTLLVVASVAIAHGVAMLSMPAGMGNLDRWIDVVVSVSVVGAVVRMLSARNDRLFARLRSEARSDTLTELLNRRGFAERLGVELARAARENYPVAFVALDIDHFKCINDEHGHEAGDRALSFIGRVLREQARGADVTARVGGEEFVAVLPRGDAQVGAEFAERVRQAVAVCEIPMTLSAGVVAQRPPIDPDMVMAAADRALYAAKRAGRNRAVVGDAAAV